MGTNEWNAQRLFEIVFFTGVVLHELSHAVVCRAFDVEYRMRLTFLDANAGRSHLLFPQVVTSTVMAVLISISPFSLIAPALLVTMLVGIALEFGSMAGTILALILVVQGIGICLSAVPSESDLEALFVQCTVFDGRLWWLSVVGINTVQFSGLFLWLIVTYGYVVGSGWSAPPLDTVIMVIGATGFSILIGLGPDIDMEAIYRAEVDLRSQYAGLCWYQNNDEEANRQFLRTIDIVEKHGIEHTTVYTSYAGLLFERGQTEAATDYCQHAIEIDPECVPSHITYAGILVRQERYDEAERHCKRALELTIDEDIERVYHRAKAHVNYAEVLREQGRFDEAEDHCHRGLEMNPDEAHAHASYAELCAERGQISDAERRYERALELGPETAVIRAGYAEFLADHGDDRAAEHQFQRALELNPDCKPATDGYATFLEDRGRSEEAQRYADRTDSTHGADSADVAVRHENTVDSRG
ncbi:tetratricopeptide repeat protein [Halopiger aswanensis]|uniref:Tfp pilus assembly protein PilF n=1 Tax=Halopiger aswanensis TaxID=148449 RepID=A0A419WHL8_9EURY|nr:tetratricopeptide repeat protein [Halopiger aswanensis]RKD94994.1 Tfp pilus assembly protein PilF [Halopiger aswanensis]